jgi:hypothetical protein
MVTKVGQAVLLDIIRAHVSAPAEEAVTSGERGQSSDVEQARRRRARWNWLLLLPLFAIIFPGLYARQEPDLWGFPFFYWYQFAVVVATAVLTGIVYLATRDSSGE